MITLDMDLDRLYRDLRGWLFGLRAFPKTLGPTPSRETLEACATALRVFARGIETDEYNRVWSPPGGRASCYRDVAERVKRHLDERATKGAH